MEKLLSYAQRQTAIDFDMSILKIKQFSRKSKRQWILFLLHADVDFAQGRKTAIRKIDKTGKTKLVKLKKNRRAVSFIIDIPQKNDMISICEIDCSLPYRGHFRDTNEI